MAMLGCYAYLYILFTYIYGLHYNYVCMNLSNIKDEKIKKKFVTQIILNYSEKFS